MLLLRILDRYVLREVFLTWVAVTGVLLIILLSNQLARVLSQAAGADFPRATVLALLGLTSLQNLSVLMPVGLFLSIMLALGRLYQESEMAAMQACGVGITRLYRPIAVLTAAVVLFLAWLSFLGSPAAATRAEQLRQEALRQAQFGSLEPGRFRSFDGGEIVFYAERVDANGILYNVFVQRSDGQALEIVTAARAEQRGAGELEQTFILYEGVRYEGLPGSAEFRIIEFSEHGIPLRLPALVSGNTREEQRPSAAIWNSPLLGDRAELHWRLSVPLMAAMLALLAVPLARLRPRQGRYGKMGLGILIFFVYTNLLAAARSWMERETVPVVLGLWWVHALVGILAVALLSREFSGRPLRPSNRRVLSTRT